MGYEFNADEIFVMAEQLERNGAQFYRESAKAVEDSDSRRFLNDLAEMEVEHEKTFKSLRTEITEKEKESTVFDPEGEAALYLRSLADSRVFFEKEMDLTTFRGILKAAITAEKDSIVFYLGMKEAVPEKLGKGRIEKIIKEEMGHIKFLSSKLISLKK